MLVLDEATANVDRDTDALILTALDEHVHPPAQAAAAASAVGQGRVLLVIAHRIDTIMDADHLLVRGCRRVGRHRCAAEKPVEAMIVLSRGCTVAWLQVLGAGELLEQGVPRELAAREGGTFAGMVQAARLAGGH